MLKILQSRGNGVERGRTNQFPASLKNLSAQQAVRGTLLYLGKTAPTPVLKRNIFLTTEEGNIIVGDDLIPGMEAFTEELRLNKDSSDELMDDFEEMTDDTY